jgi:hypothetical protein
MWRSVHDDDIPESKLMDYLEDWGLWGDDQSFDAWVIWRRSDYVVLPFSGGWFDQPWWLREDFMTLDMVRAYFDKQAEKPSIEGVTDPFENWT